MVVMYVIICYDVGVERINRLRSFLRRYLYWVQNSVFEGELTPSEFKKIDMEIKKIIDPKRDSVVIYRFRDSKLVKRIVIGEEKFEISRVI